jgi:chloramphenicol 3-O-phosphotransferase
MSGANAGPRLVFLYGPPAVGKLTVARAIAERRDFRVLHNHVTFDPVAEVLPVGTPAFWAALDKVRVDLVTAAANEGIDLVYTFVFAPGEERHADEVARAYESIGGVVLFVQLLAPAEELHRRVSSESRRAHAKIMDAASLDRILLDHDVFAAIPGRDGMTVDVSTMSAEDAATQIMERLDAVEGEG